MIRSAYVATVLGVNGYSQGFRRFAKDSGSANHLAGPHVPHEPGDVAYCAAKKVTSSGSPCSVEHPRKADQGEWEVRRGNRHQAE